MKTEIEEIKEEFEILWHRLLFLERNILVEKRKIFADINNEIGRARLENNTRSTIYHRLDNIKKKYLGDEDEW